MEKISTKLILTGILISLWIIIIQNFTNSNSKNNQVYITGGTIDNIGEDVKVKGEVDINNKVDVNISEINGHRSFYDHNYDGVYNRIPVYGGN